MGAKKRRLLGLLAVAVVLELALWAAKPTWEIDHELRIEASKDRVWGLLADFPGYAAWNTYTPSVTGELAEGAIVRSRGHLGDLQFDVKNLITEVVRGEKLCWRSRDWYGPLVKGTRCRALEARGGATVMHHHEHFEGPLAWLVAALVGRRIEQGVTTHDLDLKRAAESGQPSP